MAVSALILLLVAFCSQAFPADSFIDCEKALAAKAFSNLRKFYRQGNFSKEIGSHKPGLCARLTSSQFLVTVVGSGDLWRDGLYFVDTAKKRVKQETETRIRVGQEFTSDGPERFILLSQHIWVGGSIHEGHLLLRLAPVKSGDKVYKIYPLLFNVRDGVNPDYPCSTCSEEGKRPVSTPRNEKAESVQPAVINEGTGDAAVVYTVTEQDCVTCQKSRSTKTYRLIQEQQKPSPAGVAVGPAAVRAVVNIVPADRVSVGWRDVNHMGIVGSGLERYNCTSTQ